MVSRLVLVLTLLGTVQSYCWAPGKNPLWLGAPVVEQVGLHSVRVSWPGLLNKRECADHIRVKSWLAKSPTDYTMSNSLRTSVVSIVLNNLSLNLKYTVEVVAVEDRGSVLGFQYNRSPHTQFRLKKNIQMVDPNSPLPGEASDPLELRSGEAGWEENDQSSHTDKEMGLSSSSLNLNLNSYERNCPLSELGTRTSHTQFVFGNTGSGFATAFAIMFAMLGICFNLLVIVSLLHYRRTRRHVTTPFIISLSFLDLITAVFVLPVYAYRFHNHETPFGEFGCKMYALIFYGTQGATMLSLTMVTLNRLVMLFFPKRVDKIFTNNRMIKGHKVPLNSLIILFFCWVIPLIILSPTFLGKYGSMGLQLHTQSCTLMKNIKTGSNPKRMVMLIGILIPAATMIISDVAIFFKMKAIHATDHRMSMATVEDRKMERRFMMMLVAIFLIFFITYVPASLFKQIDKCFKYPSLQITGYLINWSSVWINPIVYVASQKKYQDALKHLKLMVTRKIEQRKQDNPQVVLAFQLDSSEKSQEPSAGGVDTLNLFPERPKTHSNSFYTSGYETEN